MFSLTNHFQMSLWGTLFQCLKVKIEEACCSNIFFQLKGANVVSKGAYLEAVKWPQTSGISKCVIQNYVVPEQWLRGAEARSKMVGGVKLHLESNPIPARDAQRAQTYLVCTRTQRLHRDWARTVFECLLQMCGSAVDCFRSRGSGCSRLG